MDTPNSFMPKVNYWSANVEAIPYDLDKAAALVKEANYDGTPIQLMVDTGNAASRQTASQSPRSDHPAENGITSRFAAFSITA